MPIIGIGNAFEIEWAKRDREERGGQQENRLKTHKLKLRANEAAMRRDSE